MKNLEEGAIGVFDSGYGGLTILSEIQKLLPQYDYIYLGDNARAPYGSRSFETVYQFTRQAVDALFQKDCNLVILACNTASAKALRTIQQNDLPLINPDKRVLGVIRPTVEIVGNISKNGHIGVLGTIGTIQSESYVLEIAKFHPDFKVSGQACPMWVPLVENNESKSQGADYFIKKYIDSLLDKDPLIDTVILGCTHYPLLEDKIREYLPQNINIISQGKYIAESLANYLERHPNLEKFCTKKGTTEYYTTESAIKFEEAGITLISKNISAQKIDLEK